MTLAAQDLHKSFKGRAVVRGVSLSVAPGETVGLLGPNGAGKTTSFYMIVGLIGADQGQILLGEQPISDLPLYARARLGIGYLPQEASIFRKLTVAENILGILELRRDLNAAGRRTELDQLGHAPLGDGRDGRRETELDTMQEYLEMLVEVGHHAQCRRPVYIRASSDRNGYDITIVDREWHYTCTLDCGQSGWMGE